LYLGRVINETWISPDPSEIKCIKNNLKLKNAKDIKSFLELFNYYSRFVDNFANIVKRLIQIYLKKDIPFSNKRNKSIVSTYDQFHYSVCKTAHNFLLCPEINPLHPRNTKTIFEVQLLQDPINVSESCEVRQIQINTTIFHKLEFQNAWL